MRSTPALDAKLKARLEEAVKHFAGGSADKFAQLIGFANGGGIRQCLLGIRPVRESVIHRVHRLDKPGASTWFADLLTPIVSKDVEATLPTSHWPFERISPEAWSNLSERQRGAIEAAAVAAMREVQSAVPEDLSRKRPARGA